MNCLTPPDRKVRRSEEQRRLDRFHRQLLHATEVLGFYTRLFYLEEDDSFFLEWKLPDLTLGSKYYVNADDCFYSLKTCLAEIEDYCNQRDSDLRVNGARVPGHNPCGIAHRAPVRKSTRVTLGS